MKPKPTEADLEVLGEALGVARITLGMSLFDAAWASGLWETKAELRQDIKRGNVTVISACEFVRG